MFTWKKGLGEIDESSKYQIKMETGPWIRNNGVSLLKSKI